MILSNTRIFYFDFLRSISIIMVIGIHTFVFESLNSISDLLIVTIRQILNCAVPIFLALSGFFLGNKSLENKQDILDFWKKQISRVYIPYLILSLPIIIYVIFNCDFEVLLIAKILLMYVGCGFSIYYFVALIIQFYIIAPLFFKRISKKILLLSIIISLLSIATIAYLKYIRGINLPLIIYAGPFFVWVMFFVLGIFLSQIKRDYSLKWLSLMLIVFLVLQVFEAFYLNLNFNGGLGIKISSFLFSFCVILVCFSSKIERFYNKYLCWLNYFSGITAKMSYTIYLTHIYIVNLVNYYMGDCWIVNWIVSFFIIFMLLYFLKKIIPIKFAKKYLGM